jgi:hypothetical protein
MSKAADFNINGYAICNNVIPVRYLDKIRTSMYLMGEILAGKSFKSLDEYWNYFQLNNRDLGSLVYNGFKRIPAVYEAAVSAELLRILTNTAGFKIPALIDVNCRIDSLGEEQYLFDWHQDYWFSVSSPESVVVWIPIEKVDHGTGSLEIISNVWTESRIFETKKGDVYSSYADAVVLDDVIPNDRSESLTGKISCGDVILFKFNLLHKSEAVTSTSNSRFTIQLRFADLADEEFRANLYKPGVVNSNNVDYLTWRNK